MNTETTSPIVFISHAEEDSDVAHALVVHIEAAGYPCWHYERDSIPGLAYLLQVSTAIEQCQVMLVIVSEQALSSPQVTNEIVRAYETNRGFIPVLRGITHSQFQQQKPLWRQAFGAAASVGWPASGPTDAVLSRIVAGVVALTSSTTPMQESIAEEANREPEPTAPEAAATAVDAISEQPALTSPPPDDETSETEVPAMSSPAATSIPAAALTPKVEADAPRSQSPSDSAAPSLAGGGELRMLLILCFAAMVLATIIPWGTGSDEPFYALEGGSDFLLPAVLANVLALTGIALQAGRLSRSTLVKKAFELSVGIAAGVVGGGMFAYEVYVISTTPASDAGFAAGSFVMLFSAVGALVLSYLLFEKTPA